MSAASSATFAPFWRQSSAGSWWRGASWDASSSCCAPEALLSLLSFAPWSTTWIGSRYLGSLLPAVIWPLINADRRFGKMNVFCAESHAGDGNSCHYQSRDSEHILTECVLPYLIWRLAFASSTLVSRADSDVIYVCCTGPCAYIWKSALSPATAYPHFRV